MALFQNQQQQLPRHNEAEYKKDFSEIQLKIGQLEAKVLADQRALSFFQSVDYSDAALYKPVEL